MPHARTAIAGLRPGNDASIHGGRQAAVVFWGGETVARRWRRDGCAMDSARASIHKQGASREKWHVARDRRHVAVSSMWHMHRCWTNVTSAALHSPCPRAVSTPGERPRGTGAVSARVSLRASRGRVGCGRARPGRRCMGVHCGGV